MRWDEVRRLVQEYASFELGVHTREHLDLTSMDVGDAVGEVTASLEQFRDELGFEARHFSFPYCRSNEQIRGRLCEIGLCSAMTSEGVVNPARADPLDLPRLEPHGRDVLMRYWTSGAHPALSVKLFGRS